MTSTGRSGARLAPQWLLSGFGSPILSAPDGAFEFRVSGWIRGGFVVVQKEGFETSYMNVTWVDARPGDTVATTLRLHAIVRIRAGETVELDILDPRVQCGADSESYPACRAPHRRTVAPWHRGTVAAPTPASSSTAPRQARR
jgi:hypothetical protein